MPKIIPIKELKNTVEISTLCHNSGEPVFITKNGYGDMVVMSIEAYEELFTRIHMYESLSESERQISEGNVREARDVLSELRKKYEL